MRPGEHPLRELRAARGLGGDRRLVLAVDQFEETFTVCRDEAERAAFVAALVRLAARATGADVVVLAIRADYYGRCADVPGAVAACSPRITCSSARCAATSCAARSSARRSAPACASSPS